MPVITSYSIHYTKLYEVHIDATSPIFKDMPEEFRATRYHSLIVKKDTLPQTVIPTSHSMDDGEIMSLQIKDKPIYGVQFHPESIMSEYGHEMLDNFLKL